MPANLNEKTTVPLLWVAALVVAGLGPLTATAVWVASVNWRLGRIERALKIDPVAKVELISSAKASEKQ